MKILLFGGSGQLGHDIQKQGRDLNFEVVSPVISEIDISESQQVLYLAEQIKPDLILNCAAYTAVDLAEKEKEQCFAINRHGAANVAAAAKNCGSRLMHISTDYVFSGEGSSPLKESDDTGPLNVYGQSKLEGEREIMRIYPDKSLIVRTSSLYGERGVNFVRTMLDLFKTKEVVKVVNDQFMSPTWTGWLAEILLDLGRINASGFVHACCSGETSWYEFAKEILRLSEAKLATQPNLQLLPVSAAEFVRPAIRPRYSVLNCDKLSGLLGRKPTTWQDAPQLHLREIGMM